jgi:hypothetical protein
VGVSLLPAFLSLDEMKLSIEVNFADLWVSVNNRPNFAFRTGTTEMSRPQSPLG